MIELLIENINIETKENREDFLDKLEEKLIEKKQEFVILKSKSFDFNKTKDLVGEIKKHFDIFVILKTQLPEKIKELEYFFLSGIHGIFFTENKQISNKVEEKQFKVLKEAVRIFSTGTVFYETLNENRPFIKNLLDNNIIPVIKTKNLKLIDFIEINLNKRKSLKGYLKFIPLVEEPSENYGFNLIRDRGFKGKVEKKIILELNNLRQKLMIKEVEESFNSSAL